jgi:2-dehydro-3-deoxygalactonokinase
LSASVFIAGDWGSSRLRLYLCGGDRVLDRRAGPGAFDTAGAHKAALLSLIEPWLARYGAGPVLLCGMVGSRNGWVEAPYAPSPAGAEDLRQRLVRVEGGPVEVMIMPGVAGPGPRGTPEVMRGEETQIIGALALAPALARGRWRLGLPGTHTKWALVEDGRIVSFQTALTGELFGLLRDHGALAKVDGERAARDGDGFVAGLERRPARLGAGLLHELFEVRSRQLLDGWDCAYALDFLSGLLIGADVEGALALFGGSAREIILIGEPALTGRYGQALAHFGASSRSLGGEECALAGLRSIALGMKDASRVAD